MSTHEKDIKPQSKYDPAYALIARNYALLGAIDQDLANFFGCTTRTIRNWRDTYPEFDQALKEGKTYADAKVVAALFKKALGYTYTETHEASGKTVKKIVHVKPDTVAQIFWLKCRQPELWNDQVNANRVGDNPPSVPQLSDMEVARRIAFVLAKAVQGEQIEGDT